MSARPTFFTSQDGLLLPTPYAHSLWGSDSLNGPAVCAVAAHAVEAEHGREGWRPGRFTLELFKNARRLPTSTTTRVLRSGGRILVVEVQVHQHDVDGTDDVVAQGVTVFVKEGTDPPGLRWSRPESERTFFPPAEADGNANSYFGDDEQGWTTKMGDHQHGGRHRLWSVSIPVHPEAELTPFVRAIITAESTSLITNWGEGGIGFINCDLTVTLVRLPRGRRVGVEADQHLEMGGTSIGTASLFDADGQFGIGMVTAVDNSRALIDFTKVPDRSHREA